MSLFKSHRIFPALLLVVLSIFYFSPVSGQGAPYKVIFIMSEKCPICQFYTLEIKELNQKYGDEMKFKLLFSNALSTRKSLREFESKYSMQIKMQRDHKLKKARKLGAEITPQVFVLDKSGELIYKGRIDNNFERIGVRRRVVTHRELRDVLSSLSSGNKSDISNTNAVGCQISFLKKSK